ncbi:hypothetical protein Tco_1440748 [Tanacetum coccineum]
MKVSSNPLVACIVLKVSCLLSLLLSMVNHNTVVIVVVILIVVVDDVSLILKLSFAIIGGSLGPVFLLGLSAFAMVAACASKAAVKSAISFPEGTKTLRGYGMIHEDGDNDAIGGNDDEGEINNVVEEEDEEQIRFLGGNSSSGTKKYRGSNSSDGGNTRDRVKIAGEVKGIG